jgi:iron complex outermembrane receptor protein
MSKYYVAIFLLFQLKIAVSQQKTISIKDTEGNPIEDVWVLSLPDSTSYFTNSDGITSVNQAEYLQLFKLGYLTQTIEFSSIIEQEVINLEIDDIILNEVIVGSNLRSRKLKNNPGNIDYLSKQSIQQSNPTIITDRLNQIPGIFMQSGALNTNRITIRGIGSRSPFSTNKIRAYYNDIPLTNGTGETTIEDIDLEAIGSMEVIKGPNSSKYGSGLGGVILINPYDGANLSNSINLNTTMGSFGQLKNGVNLNLNKNNVVSTNLSVNRLSSDGYRENNELDRMNIQLTNEIRLKNDKISFIGYFVDQKAFIPSSLGITDFTTNPEKAANNWAEAQGFEDYYTLHLGLGWDHIISDKADFIIFKPNFIC